MSRPPLPSRPTGTGPPPLAGKPNAPPPVLSKKPGAPPPVSARPKATSKPGGAAPPTQASAAAALGPPPSLKPRPAVASAPVASPAPAPNPLPAQRPPPKPKPAAPAAPQPSATVMYDFAAEADDELSAATGATVRLLGQPDDDWFEAELDGVRGRIPISFVEVTVPLEAQTAGAPAAQAEAAQAPASSTAPKANSLAAILAAANRPSQAAAESPAAAEVASDGPPSLPPLPGPYHPLYHYVFARHKPRAVCTQPFQAEAEDELNLHVGDTVLLVGRISDAWLKGKVASGSCGMFPQEFVTIHQALPNDDGTTPFTTDDDDEATSTTTPAATTTTATAPPPASANDPPPMPGIGFAVLENSVFGSDSQGTLTAQRGEMLTVLRENGNWYECEQDGIVGHVPKAQCEFIPH